MSDLPALRSIEVTAFREGLSASDVVFSADRHEAGTNAMGIELPAKLGSCFGHPDSLRRHTERASALGLRIQRVDSPGLRADLDEPADLDDPCICQWTEGYRR